MSSIQSFLFGIFILWSLQYLSLTKLFTLDNETVARVPIRRKSGGIDDFDRRRSELLKRKQGAEESAATNNNKRIKKEDVDGDNIEKMKSRFVLDF